MPFSQKSLEFLYENRDKNSREWFENHRGDYITLVQKPLAELTKALTPTMLQIDENFICEPKTGRALSRIYRDTRFSRDKSIFRDVMWCVFMRDKKLYGGIPGYFFEVSPYGFRRGCGYYCAASDSMEAIRRLILARSPGFDRAEEALEKQSVFALEGETYKRSRYPQETVQRRSWLDRKTVCLIAKSDDLPLLYSDRLPQVIAAEFLSIAPIYNFLIEAETRKSEILREV